MSHILKPALTQAKFFWIFSTILLLFESLECLFFFSDVIFFIFLYQKWIYPVDHQRINEFGTSGEIEEKIKQGIHPDSGSVEKISNGSAAKEKDVTLEDKKNL